ncbi:MAG: hypothetical protein JXR36_01250 [Bacteroidales bacterium]|nr:hypothetical protein [Bacteroidales bacterium]
MKKSKKTILIVATLLVAGIIMWYVWQKQQPKEKDFVITPRVQELADRVPFETRKKIVGVYDWYMQNSNPYIWKDGKIFNTRKNEFDPYQRPSIELKVLDDVLWDIKTNYGLIDASTEWWLKSTKNFTINELRASLNVK